MVEKIGPILLYSSATGVHSSDSLFKSLKMEHGLFPSSNAEQSQVNGGWEVTISRAFAYQGMKDKPGPRLKYLTAMAVFT
jgi:hypothetical protein